MAQPTKVVDLENEKQQTDEGSYEPGWYSILKETSESSSDLAKANPPARARNAHLPNDHR
jgi:hypothetical protein